MTTNAPAGWYADPENSGVQRWWDGVAWTDVRQSSPTALVPPPAPVEAAPAASRRRRLPVWAWILIGIVALGLGILVSPLLATLALVVLITGIVSLAKNTRTWLGFRNRRGALVATALSAVLFLGAGSISSATYGHRPTPHAAATGTSAPAVARPTASPKPSAEDALGLIAFHGAPSTANDTSVTSGRAARDVLATIPVKGRAAKTGYARGQFGQRWLDVDRNGCDTRNDALGAQLTDVVRRGSCTVLSGTLADPYTGTSIGFVRGPGTSDLVQIDHVVSLSNAWQTGAQALTADQRATFANDPLNLQAVHADTNMQKSDGDAATWLPRNKGYRCAYVARQIAVKAAYGLWVTQAEHDAMAGILDGCPGEPSATSVFAAVAPSPQTTTAPTAPTAAPAEPVPFVQQEPAPAGPAPEAPAPAPPANVYYANCAAARAAGAAPIRAGQPGYSRKLDRDGDGIACE